MDLYILNLILKVIRKNYNSTTLSVNWHKDNIHILSFEQKIGITRVASEGLLANTNTRLAMKKKNPVYE